MKKFGARKIVLYSVALFSAIMLLIGLAFTVLTYDLGMGSAVGSVLKKAGYSVSGFEMMMSFEFPLVLRSEVSIYVFDPIYELFEILIGVMALLTLIYSLLEMCLIILSFFKNQKEKGENNLKLILIIGLVLAVAYTVIAVVFAIIVNSEYKDAMESVNTTLNSSTKIEGGFYTSAYFTTIIQVICVIAFFVCCSKIKQTNTVVMTGGTVTDKTELRGNVAKTENIEEALDSLLFAENSVMDLLKEYKDLCEDSIITSAEYMEKKVKLIKTADKKIKQGVSSLIEKASFDTVAHAEVKVTKILRQYNKMLKDGIISDSEYIEKKVSLLSYII